MRRLFRVGTAVPSRCAGLPARLFCLRADFQPFYSLLYPALPCSILRPLFPLAPLAPLCPAPPCPAFHQYYLALLLSPAANPIHPLPAPFCPALSRPVPPPSLPALHFPHRLLPALCGGAGGFFAAGAKTGRPQRAEGTEADRIRRKSQFYSPRTGGMVKFLPLFLMDDKRGGSLAILPYFCKNDWPLFEK